MNLEKEFTIPIPKTKFKIYAKQYGGWDKPIVIFVHGLSGHMEEHILYNGARYFYEQGFSSIRFNLYDWPKEARKLINCTLKTHAEDFEVVHNYVRRKTNQKIWGIGHSYGGPSILLAQHNKLDGIVLWDPSYGDLFKSSKYIEDIKAYRIRWGFDLLIGVKMRQEAKDLPWANLTQDTTVPLKIINAGKGILLPGGQQYIHQSQGPKELAVIKNADHSFNAEGTAEQLFTESISWLKRFSQ